MKVKVFPIGTKRKFAIENTNIGDIVQIQTWSMNCIRDTFKRTKSGLKRIAYK